MSKVRVNPTFTISSASSNGTTLTYICNNNFSSGTRVRISGSSNPNFDTADSEVTVVSSTQFSISKSVSASATSTGGTALRVFSEWRDILDIWVKPQGLAATRASAVWVKVDGAWKRTTIGNPPPKPTIVWHTTGQFRVTNYDQSLIYYTTFATGSGNIALTNSASGIYTLDGPNSGFRIESAFVNGGKRSPSGYMERKARSTSYGQSCSVCGQNPSYQCNCSCSPNQAATCNEPPGPNGQCPNPAWPNASCGCYDGNQNRCICWNYGPPYCNCQTCGGDCKFCNIDTNFSSQGYTDRITEWSKEG